MNLYLMQHGLALSEEEDPERPLSPDGEAQVRASAAGLHAMGLQFDRIASSTKKRALQTAQIVAEVMGYSNEVAVSDALKPRAAPAESMTFILQRAKGEAVFVAGHLPSLSNIASYLLGGEKQVKVTFENAAVCAIQSDDLAAGSGELLFSLPADVLSVAGAGR